MKKYFFLFSIIFFLSGNSFNLFSQIKFEDYFESRTLRIDYIHAGNATENSYYLHELKEEPYWGGSKTNLLDIFNYGKYKIEIRDSATNKEIYSRFYSTLFSEWQTTAEAKEISKSFHESVVVPFPKKTVKAIYYTRDKKHNLHNKFELYVNPNNYFISTERRLEFPKFEIINNGDPANKVDIVILPEGYTADEMNLFREDCKKFSQYLFNSSPFKENKNKFNIWGVAAPSPESGTDIPAENIWKKTLLNTSFYTFDIERYLMTEDYKSVRDLAANAPYDQIYILVNSEKYGGGAIYNFYNVCINRHRAEEYVFVHELGHGFAFLADEYYTSDVAYENFYSLDIEPLEANLTTLVDFNSKWKHLVDKETPIPTPNIEKYKDKVGAFEGGGYVAKGIFRPEQDCSMKSISIDNFCVVCKNAIEKMINFYAE